MRITFLFHLILSCVFNSFYPALNIPNMSVLVTTTKEIRHHPDNLLECFVYYYFLVKVLVRLVKIFYSYKGLCFLTKLNRVMGTSDCLKNFTYFFDRAGKHRKGEVGLGLSIIFFNQSRYFHIDKVFFDHVNPMLGGYKGYDQH